MAQGVSGSRRRGGCRDRRRLNCEAGAVMSSWWSDHPDLEGVARHGRRELEQEAAAAEHDTELLRRRRRSLVDVCFEWMSRGDLITVAVGGQGYEGRLVAAVNDLAIVETKTLRIAVNLSLVDYVRSDRPAAFAGSSGERSVTSFRAALGRCEIDATPVRLLDTNQRIDVVGVIAAATEDHVLLRDKHGLEWMLPRSGLAAAVVDS